MQGIRSNQPGTSAPVPRVAILYSSSLLMQGMEAYLRRAERLEVAGLDVDLPETWDRLRSLRPDALIMDASDVRAAHDRDLDAFIRSHPQIRIIDMRPGCNTIDVYHKHEMEVVRPGDLLQALTGE